MVMKHVGKWWDHEWQKQRECALMKAKHGNQICKKELNRTILVYVLHVVLSQTSGISTTSKLLRLLSGIRKMMFHNAFFFLPPLPKFSRDEIPKSCHIWEKDLFWVSTSNLELFQVLEQGSLTSCREPSAACDLAIWESSATKTGTKRRSFQTDQILSASTDIYRYLPVIFDVSHAFQA